MTDNLDPILLSSGSYQIYSAFWQKYLTLTSPPHCWSGTLQIPQEAGRVTHTITLPFHVSERILQLGGHKDPAIYTIALACLALTTRDQGTGPLVLRVAPMGKDLDQSVNRAGFLRLSLDDQASLKHLLQGTKELLRTTYESWPYPIAKAVGSAAFSLLQRTDLSLRFEGLHEPLEPAHITDMVLSICRVGDGLTLDFNLPKGCHWIDVAQALAERFTDVINAFSSGNLLVGQLDILSAENHQLLRRWSGAPVQVKTNQPETIHSFFEHMAAAQPDAPALVFDSETFTYKDINSAANRLARELQGKYGLGHGDRVALLFAPSERMIIGIMAVLKAGGTYLPINPEEPTGRNEAKLKKAAPKVILLDSEWMYELEVECPVFAMDLQLDHLKGSEENLAPPVAETPAYIIFTSGSSGEPKGVVVPHRGVCALIEAQAAAFEVAPGRRVLQFATFTFDASVSEIFVTLGKGATLYLASRQQLMPGPEMVSFLQENEIDMATLPPAVLRLLEPGDFPKLRTVISAGEKCDRSLVSAWAPGRRFIDAYGPTEASVCATLGVCDPQHPRDANIGKPLPGQDIYILSPKGRKLTPGATGELCIGGGLAQGYLDMPAVTAKVFLPHPFSDVPGARLYHTGDLCAFQADGTVAYRGRADHQVKLRGFRIELEEIEKHCVSQPCIKAAAVAVTEDGAGLIAYITPHEHSLPIIDGLERYTLPNGMAITCHQKGETDFIYGEVFEKHLYGTHMLTLKPGDTVFDVGANIGLFSLYAQQLCEGGRIYSFEPMPPNFTRLVINTRLYAPAVKAFNCGLAERDGEACFAFYPKSTGASGRYTDQEEEEAVVRALIHNQEKVGGKMASESYTEELVAGMFEKEMYDVKLRRLSDVIREEGVTWIDLLKIDVEKSELDVLNGLDEEHWSIIGQMVLEVHDLDGRLDTISKLLEKHQFNVVVDQDELLHKTNLYNIYAVRNARDVSALPQLPKVETHLFDLAEVRNTLARHLPDYMVPSRYHVMDRLPLTLNGKVDKDALPKNVGVAAVKAAETTARTGTEEMILGLFNDILSVSNKDVNASFFNLGGHSLLATQLISRIRTLYKLDLPLRVLFQAPTPALFAALIDAKVEQEQGLEEVLIEAVSREATLPLSLSQQRLWVLDKLEPENNAYNVPFAFQLLGDLNTDVLQRTFNEIMKRHEVLRTAFPDAAIDSQPQQIIHPFLEVTQEVMDFSAYSEEEQQSRLAQAHEDEARSFFTLAKPPLVRWQIIKMAQCRHVVLYTLHHIVSDGWSMGIIVKEIAAIYRAFLEDQPCPLEPLAIQYADYASWQNQQVSEPRFSTQLHYWEEQLAKPPRESVLPQDKARPDQQKTSGLTLQTRLSPELSEQLTALSRQNNCTLFMTLIAALKVLIHRHTGQTDMVLGTVIAGRNNPQIEPLIGFFLNNLAIRSNPEPNMPFIDFCQAVREVTLSAYAHQDVPFERILQGLDLPRDLATTPLFQTLVIHQNAPTGKLELPGLTLEPITLANETAKFDLTVMTMETAQGLMVNWNFNRDLYSMETMTAYSRQFQNLLQAIVSAPQNTIGTLAYECEAPVKPTPEFNPSFEPFPPYEITGNLDSRFQAIVAQYGDREALTHGGSSLTYRQLNQAVNRVANTLLKQGTTTVGLLFEPGEDAIIGLFGALRVGILAVPLDASHPQKRLEAILEDCNAATLLVHSATQSLGAQLCGGKLQLIALHESGSDHDPNVPIAAESPAYILYTSGSTGKPKGVVQAHQNLMFYTSVYSNNLQITAEDRLSLFSSFTFDAGLMDIFGALLNGAALCCYSLRTLGLSDLPDWVESQSITILHFVPTIYRHFISSLLESRVYPKARLVVLGGEAAISKDLEDFNRHFTRNAYLVNGFGPTESTVSMQHFMPWGSCHSGANLPLGYAVNGMEVRLANPAGCLVEGMGRGEIVLCCPHLALGYHGNQEATKAAFFLDENGEYCYRTGDMGRRFPDGHMEYAGRKDFQVKVRGHRVELSEIERCCRHIEGVKEATVHFHRDETGQDVLTAYLVIEKSNPPNTEAAQAYFKENLPQYMLPNHFMILESLPLTVTGKVDRTALPLPTLESGVLHSAFAAPQTPTEKSLAHIWGELLKKDKIGIHENLFKLGAHSLTAIQAILKIREVFLMELPLRELFDNPTIAEQARTIERDQSQDEDDALMQALLDQLENEA